MHQHVSLRQSIYLLEDYATVPTWHILRCAHEVHHCIQRSLPIWIAIALTVQ